MDPNQQAQFIKLADRIKDEFPHDSKLRKAAGEINNLVKLNVFPQSKIPSEVSQEVFSYLNLNQIGEASLVSRAWRGQAETAIQQKVITLKSNQFSIGDAINYIIEHDLKKVDLSQFNNINDSHLRKLAENCPNLQHVNLGRCWRVTDEGLKNLANNCHKLQHIDVTECEFVTDEGLKSLADKCTKLQQINCEYCGGVSEDGRRNLAQNFPHLFDLDME